MCSTDLYTDMVEKENDILRERLDICEKRLDRLNLRWEHVSDPRYPTKEGWYYVVAGIVLGIIKRQGTGYEGTIYRNIYNNTFLDRGIPIVRAEANDLLIIKKRIEVYFLGET